MRCSCCCILPAVVAVVAMGLIEMKGWRRREAVLFFFFHTVSNGAFERPLLATALVAVARVRSKLYVSPGSCHSCNGIDRNTGMAATRGNLSTFPQTRCCPSEVRVQLLSSAFVPAARVTSNLYVFRAATFFQSLSQLLLLRGTTDVEEKSTCPAQLQKQDAFYTPVEG